MEKIISHRLYLSGASTQNDRGIACYSKCLGAFLKCFGFATKYTWGSRTYYVNTKSLRKYTPRPLPPIPIPSRQTIIRPTNPEQAPSTHSSIVSKMRDNLPEAIQEIPDMPLNQFANFLQNESFFFTILGAYSETVQPLYLGLKPEQQVLLLDKLLQDDFLVILLQIRNFLIKDDALQAAHRAQNDIEKLATLCYICSQKDFFPDLLQALNLENFEKICSRNTFDTKIIPTLLTQNNDKSLAFLKTRQNIRQISSCWENCGKDLKVQFWEHLKTHSKDYFDDSLYDEPSLVFMQEFLENMQEEEIRTYTKSNTFVFASALNIRAKLFSQLISQLDGRRAARFVLGLWENSELDAQLKVESLSLIYSTLKPKNTYSSEEQLTQCMSAALYQMQQSNTWETFLSKTMPSFEDGLDGNNIKAFTALLIVAVYCGIQEDSARSAAPLLKTLLAKHEHVVVGYKILGKEGIHPILARKLCNRGQKKKLIELAKSSSQIFKELLKDLVLGEY